MLRRGIPECDRIGCDGNRDFFWWISEVRSPIATSDDIAREIRELKQRLIALDTECSEIAERLQALEREYAVHSVAPDATGVASINMASPTAAKINLFRSLFSGREDVFPRRWENPRTGKAGYAPACRNEWVRGVCGKPQVKCGECPNQAFVPFGEEVIRWHLQGRTPSGASGGFTAGVYPMLSDETCWFLVADFDKKS